MTHNTQKIALITGGNRGLGRASALALAAAGIDVVHHLPPHADEAEAVVDEVDALGRVAVALPLDTARARRSPPSSTRCAARSRRPGTATRSTTWSTTRATRRDPARRHRLETVDTLFDTSTSSGVYCSPRRCCRCSPTAAGSSTPPPAWPGSPATGYSV